MPRSRIAVTTFVLGLALIRAADATPIVFEFNMPAFTDGEFGGQTSTLRVTADNGGSSAANQVFLNTEIFGLHVQLGTVSFGLLNPPASRSTLNSIPYITTDSSGAALLDLSRRVDSYVVIGDSLSSVTGGIQLATDNRTSNPLYFIYALNLPGLNHEGYIRAIYSDDVVIRGNQVIPVPEPGSLALLGIGVFGFAATRRFGRKALPFKVNA